MKAKKLISILQNNPDADVVVSTVKYYEKSYFDAGYRRVNVQHINSITVDIEANQIQLDGGKEQKV